MCLIAYAPKGQLIPREIFDRARRENSDGIGIVSRAGVAKFLGPRAGKRAWRHLRSLSEQNLAYGIHFRWATHGAVTRENCHPFRSASGVHVMHNGVIDLTAADKERSDTALFVERFMPDAPAPTAAEAQAYYEKIGRIIDASNKLLVHRAGSFLIVNEDSGTWHEGLWYSNSYSLGRARHYAYASAWDWQDDDSYCETPRRKIRPSGDWTQSRPGVWTYTPAKPTYYSLQPTPERTAAESELADDDARFVWEADDAPSWWLEGTRKQ